jgi:hypothetical protein
MRTARLAPAATVLALARAGGATGAQWSEPLLIAPMSRSAAARPSPIGGSARPTGYVRVRLHGRGGAPRLSEGRYRVTVRAVDDAGRHAVARAVTLKVTRKPSVSSAG